MQHSDILDDPKAITQTLNLAFLNPKSMASTGGRVHYYFAKFHVTHTHRPTDIHTYAQRDKVIAICVPPSNVIGAISADPLQTLEGPNPSAEDYPGPCRIVC